jgi:hypothetical protein
MSDRAMESEDEITELLIHTPCGLPVELCTCPDARLVYDWERDVFIDRGEGG